VKDKALETAQRFWRGFLAFTPGQKAVTIAAILALSVGGYLFSSWASKPDYAPLFTNLAPSDASSIIDKLNTTKTPYQLAANGTEILVPQKQVYNLRLTMSSAGLPSSGSTGYSLLDKEGITTSEFKQQVDYQRALEGELDKTIKSINGVADAAVHLAIPQQTVFDDGTQKPTASVLITTTPGTQLASAQVQSVINLVSSSVPSLTADQVSVSDSNGHVLSAAGTAGGLTVSSDRAQMTQQYEQQLNNSAQSIVDKLVGPGHSQVSTIADLNFDKSTINSHTYTYASGVPPLSEQSSGEAYGPGAGASAGGGALGANSATPKVSSSTGGAYSNSAITRDNAVGDQTTNTTTAPGNVRSVSIAVLLDKNSSQVDQAQIKSLVAAAVGLNPKRGDTISVEVAPFDTTAADAANKAAAKASAAIAASKQSAAMMSMVKTGGVILLVVIIVVATFIASRRRKGEDDPQDDLDAFLSTLRDDPGSLPPAPEDIVPAKGREAQQAAHRQQQLSELADNDPAEVARLLRNWLNAKEN
jgi:flagellar M-ring protein FliF